jgi:type IV secretion system protein VirB1
MDGATFIALAAICAPLVHPTTAQAIVATESGFSPNAIGVVAGSLERQPRNAADALATARLLQTTGRNFSVGLAQINVHNLPRLGLSLSDAFDACKNLEAMQTLLLDCYERAGSSFDAQLTLRRSLSCYYSGNFATGFKHGYVKRVVDAADAAARAPP